MSTNASVIASVVKKKVQFISEGKKIVGDLFLPAGFDANKKYAATIVEGTWTSVKEQMSGLYARRFAEKGLIALAFDYRYYGESEGEPRNYESPEAKIIDLKNAAGYLSGLPYVDTEKLFATGVCASAQYVTRAAAEDSRIRKIALIAPWIHNAAIVREMYGGEEGVNAKIEAGNKAKEKFDKTGSTDYTITVSATYPSAAMVGDFFTYYFDKTRGLIPEWPNQFAIMSWPEWLQFDGIQVAGKLTTPTLIVHSEQAAIPHGVKQFFSELKSPVKEIEWTTGGQFDFYDQEPNVGFSVDRTIKFFQQ